MNQIHNSFLLPPPAQPLSLSLLLLRQARFALSEEFLIKISRAVDPLSNDQLWWRPNEGSNSIGNLMLHLAGNARQWIVAGVGGAEDLRDRNREFSERIGMGKAELLTIVTSALEEVDQVLANLENEVTSGQSDAPLQRLCVPQGFTQTVLDALCHVVQHFSYHAGQIVYVAKLQMEGSVKFYDDRLLVRKSE